MSRRTSSPIVPDEFGDYDSPVLKTLREVWNRFLEDAADEDDVLGAVREARLQVDSHIDNLQAQVDANISDPDAPLFRSVARAFVEHLEALELMEREFDLSPDDPEYDDFFERGYMLAQAATNRMMQAHEATLEQIDKEGWTACGSCGARNLVTNRECHSCRVVLPKEVRMVSQSGRQSFLAEEVTVQPSVDGTVTENFLSVKRAVDRWLDQREGLSSVLGTIGEVKESMRLHLEDISRLLDSLTAEEQGVSSALLETDNRVSESLNSLSRLERALTEPQPKTAVVRVRMVELETLSKGVAESYHQLKQAYEDEKGRAQRLGLSR